MRDEFDKVIAKFGQAWVDRDPDTVMSLVAHDNLQYFETNFDPPTTDWDEVKKLWDVVPTNQKDITWRHKIVLVDGNKALAHAQVNRTKLPSGTKEISDCAFLFGFDKDNKINYFRQWRSVITKEN